MKLQLVLKSADEQPAEPRRSESRRDFGGALAFFLLQKSGSIFGTWEGRMRAAEQRALFGRFLGKGLLIIDGNTERLTHRVTRCFGLDYEDTASFHWAQL